MQPLVFHSPSHTKNIPQHHQPPLHTITSLELPVSFFDRSELNQQHLDYTLAFQASTDRSQDIFNLVCEAEGKNQFMMLKAHNSSEQTQQDHLYSVLSFRRGFSQQYELESIRREEICKEQAIFGQQLVDQWRIENNQLIFPTQENQSIKSAKNQAKEQTQQSKTEESKQKQEEKKISTKNVTKNVTKNMGKLLFKWIWANRHKLQSKLTSNKPDWSKFITSVKQWKKENNITRKFLSQKWHSTHHTSQLFRIASAHFFRTKCISSIYQSNIQEKQIHIQRIRRFLEAVSDSYALDSLN